MSNIIIYIILGATGIPIVSFGVTLLFVKGSESMLPGFRKMRVIDGDGFRHVTSICLTAMALIIIIGSFVFIALTVKWNWSSPMVFVAIYIIVIVAFSLAMVIGCKKYREKK